MCLVDWHWRSCYFTFCSPQKHVPESCYGIINGCQKSQILQVVTLQVFFKHWPINSRIFGIDCTNVKLFIVRYANYWSSFASFTFILLLLCSYSLSVSYSFLPYTLFIDLSYSFNTSIPYLITQHMFLQIHLGFLQSHIFYLSILYSS